MITWRRLLFAGCILFSGNDYLRCAGLPEGEATVSEAKAKGVRAFLVPEKSDAPAGRFSSSAQKISVGWEGRGLKAGDRLTAIWIAEDLGLASQRESKITEERATAYKPDDDGVFTLGRPPEGWPAGKYRIELYLNGQLAQALRFTIVAGATIEVH